MDAAPPLPRRLLAALICAGLAGAALVLIVGARAGPGVTPDSVTYLSTAGSLLSHGRYEQYDGRPERDFPPLYPTLIAAASLGVFDLLDTARAINALAFGATVILTSLCAYQITRSPRAMLAAGIATLLAPPLLTVALHIWSESLFIALTMVALLLTGRYLARPTYAPLCAAAGAASLALLTRYIGVTVAAALLSLLLTRPGMQLGTRLRHALLATAIIAGPVLLWLIRTYAVASTFAGERNPSATSLKHNLYDAAATWSGWLLPDRLPLAMRLIVIATLTALALVALLATRPAIARSPAWSPVLVFVPLYGGYLVATASLTAIDMLDDRLLSPLLPPTLVLALAALCLLADRIPIPTRPWLATVALGAPALVWLTATAAGEARLIDRAVAGDLGGYARTPWRNSLLLRSLRDDPLPGAIISNDPFAIWYHTGTQAALSPRRHPYRSPSAPIEDLDDLRQRLLSGEPIYLVWFPGVARDFLLNLHELATTFDLVETRQADDGQVYRLIRR